MALLGLVAAALMIAGAGCGGCGHDEVPPAADACTDPRCACPGPVDDPANCGACGHDCGGAACSAGACLPESLALVPNEPSELGLAGNDLVFATSGTNTSTGTVYRLAKTGGTPTVVYRGLAAVPALGLAEDGSVLVADTGQIGGCDPTSSAGSLLSVASGAATLVSMGRRCVSWVTPTASGLTWVEEIARNISGSAPDPWIGMLLAGGPADQAPDFIRPPVANRKPRHLTRVGDTLLWSEDASIMQWSGGVTSVVFTASGSGFTSIDAFSADTNQIAYVARDNSATLLVLRVRATNDETTLAEDLIGIDQVALDGDFAYMLGRGVVSYVDLHTLEHRDLFTGVQAFVQDERFLYLLVHRSRDAWPRTEVVRLRKPAAGAAMSSPTCAAPLARCDQFDPTCTDLRSDDAHCGACDTACAQTERCVASSCVCGASSLVCSGTCVDPATDAANCGACGRSCGAGTCAGGDCTPVKIADFAQAAVHDTSAVYFAVSGQIRRFDKTSATNALVAQLATPYVYARYITQDATRIFIAADTGTIGAENPGGIYVTAKTGTGSAPLPLYTGRADPRQLAIANGILAWTEDATISDDTPVKLFYAAADGSGILGSISAASFYPGADTADVRGVAVAGSSVYWLLGNSSMNHGAIVRVDLGAAPVTATLLTELDVYPYSIAVVGAQLYVTGGWPDGRVLSLPLAGGALTVHAKGLLYPSGLVSTPDGEIAWVDGDSRHFIHQRAPTAANARVIQSGNQVDYGTVLMFDNDRLFTSSINGVFVMQR